MPEPKMNLRKGSKVWAEDKNLAWVAAEVTDFLAKQVKILTVTGKQVLIVPEKLCPRDADEEEEHGGVDDMTKLTYLNEPGVLYNLQRRYALNDIYVWISQSVPFFFFLCPNYELALDTSSVYGKPCCPFGIEITDAEKYKLDNPHHFHYLNQSKIYELDGVSNAEEYIKTRRAMDIVGISNEDQEAIFRILAAILHLGNIEFSPGKEHDSSTVQDEKSSFHMQMAADLFMCDANLLFATLCTRTIQTREGNIIKALDCNAAVASRDALAKTVYARLFDWLVEKVNRSVGQDPTSQIQVGVLDIYGFECFKYNSFEQFCINFANEKLQQHFNEHVFKMEQEEYRKEEINWSYIEFIDNQDVLDLIEKKPIGIIALLDEACMFPKSTHETFSTKLFQNFRANPRLEKAKFSETDFTVSHYAGKACYLSLYYLKQNLQSEFFYKELFFFLQVTYQTDTFLDKNRDYVVVEHCNLMSSSKCHFVAGLFPLPPEESSRSSYKFSSVASRFKQQLQALMETLKSTEPHYIRCVKPNSMNRPQKFETSSILHQLRCGGVLEAVRISLAGYPTRRSYTEFVDRFGLLAPEFDGSCSYDEKTWTEKILHKLKLDNFQLGRTKVFLRAGQIGILDLRRAEVLDGAAKRIQRQLCTFIARRDFLATRAAAFAIQSYCRGCLARKTYAAKRERAAAVSIQKYVRKWLLRRAYLKLLSAAIFMQSNIHGFLTRKRFLQEKRQRAATLIQARWKIYKFRSALRHRQASITAIQCRWRQKLAKRELRRLRQEANEAGALRLAKTKLEKQLEDLTWRVHLEKRLRVSNDEAKSVEISKLRNTMSSMSLELDASKLATINECNKNAVLLKQLELTVKEKSALERELIVMAELRKENALLKSSLDALEKKNSAIELELIEAQKNGNDTTVKLREIEEKCSQFQQNVRRRKFEILDCGFSLFQGLEEKLSHLEDENHVLRQKTLTPSSKSNRPGYVRAFSEKYSSALALAHSERKSAFESPTPSKLIVPSLHGLSESRRSKFTAERHQENYEFLSKCIKEDLGFIDGKPLAACIVYRCLLHWHAFESERTAIFDYIIEGINEVLKVGDENITLPYWLSNASALLCLLQRNLRSNGFLTAAVPSSTSSGLPGRVIHGLKSPFKIMGYEDGMSHVEARYPAILFKQQLTACVEKIFGLIRDNLKKELSPLLGLCIQAPKSARHAGKSSRSPSGIPQQAASSQWESIIKFLDSLMDCLRENHVPSFFIRKLITQVFSFVNISLFNSLLLRRECCSFSNGEYVKSGLAELEKWIAVATEEYAGTSWHELNYIRQAVGFLVIHQKRKKSLQEIMQDLCPALTVRQIYRISTMYWDDKYGTQSVVAQMREMLNKDNQNMTSNSFLLDDDLSIPFSTEDIDMAIPVIDPSSIELPKLLTEHPCAQFLVLCQT
ncbi:hypothetical protein DKX38_010373 [Salix brachista]|uniref:Myosin motor domain-containing protein n=1 Tax=Salix brachista TaxID=2182728 RepID=A0A5N5MDK2_9ROSI|nr:hypothetical protein DKX38_010373 [Salix brachista]